MRARRPDVSGFVDRDGVAIAWERFGHGEPALLFLQVDPIVDARVWKAQIPWLARTHTVVTFDPRGNGRSGRPAAPAAFADGEMVADAIAVLDAAGVERACVIGLCQSAGIALVLAAQHTDRVAAVVAVNPGINVSDPHTHRAPGDFDHVLAGDDGWAKENRHYWERDWVGYCQFFFAEMAPEPHSTKQREDCVEWARQAGAATMIAYRRQPLGPRQERAMAEAVCRGVRCPVLVICGDEDRCQPPARSRAVAELTHAELLVLEGAGHLPNARHPVQVNLAIGRFLRARLR